MDYNTLVNRLAKTMVLDPAQDPDFPTMLPAIIEAAELRCYRDVNPVAMRQTAITTILPGVGAVALPGDFVCARTVTATGPAGSKRIALDRRDNSFLDDFWPDRSVLAQPRFWSEVGFATLSITPPPDLSYVVELEYIKRPAPLSAANPTTWLSSYLPDLFFAAAMSFAAGYQRDYGQASDDPNQANSWEATYQKLLAAAVSEEARRRGRAPPAGGTGAQ